MNNNQIIDMQCNETTGRIMRPVAYIKSDFTSKFGIPRQSGLADLEAEIHFYPEYQNPEAVRGLEEYSHLWLIWEFSQAIRKEMCIRDSIRTCPTSKTIFFIMFPFPLFCVLFFTLFVSVFQITVDHHVGIQ